MGEKQKPDKRKKGEKTFACRPFRGNARKRSKGEVGGDGKRKRGWLWQRGFQKTPD